MKLIKIKGHYSDLGKIEMENNIIMNWNDLTDEEPMLIPFGSTIEFSIAFEEHDFLNGKEGIVWASYDMRQIEIIKNALFAQNINAELKPRSLGKYKIFLLKINNNKDISDAVDFIWRSKTGLRLKPDWNYPEGTTNKSFEQWLSEH
ncbi:MAG TPA: hypothetical protein VF870_08920 [Ignavibacteriaceae bacterium]